MTTMTRTRPAAIDPVPSVKQSQEVRVSVAASVPSDAGAVGVPVTSDGEVPAQLGLSREALAGAGFTAEVGQTWLIPRSEGPFLVAVGIGDRAALDATRLRDAAAAFARAAHRQAHLAGPLADVPNVAPDVAAQAAVEGVLLARYRYNALKAEAARDAPGGGDHRRPRRSATRPWPGGPSGARSPPRRSTWPAT